MAFEKDPNELGALWKKTGAKGEYLTGTIEVNGQKINVVCFATNNDPGSNRPAWRVLKSVPKADKPEASDVDDRSIPF